MKLDDFTAAFEKAPLLELSDITHSADEARLFRKCLTHTILRIIIAHGGKGFSHFRKNLQETLPVTPDAIQVHKTHLHPLPTWKIDESTIVGNAEVDEAVVAELQLRNQPSTWMKHVRIIAGDQLSIARLRTLAQLRAGHVGGYGGFGWGAWLPGLFHGKMADMHGIFVTHWGKPNAGTRNPGALSFHNTLLRHLPISLTSLPTFRTCRDLVFVSLYSRVLHCLLLVSGYKSLDEYCSKVQRWETLEEHARHILENYANPRKVSQLRQERDQHGGDMVFENAVLFLRDSLVSREFTDAVKAGDSGRILLVVKIWALSFRGNGRSKYAYEMLMLIHNICKVWPKKIVKIIMNNWVLNPSGNINSFVEVDLVQEHMNFWIKLFYKAHGPNSTWEWLEMISPCVHALRHLATTMKKVLGTDIGTRHSPVDLTTDIATLMRSLAEHDVYSVVKGRKLDDDDKPAVDVITEGMLSLVEGAALEEYNTTFIKLQERRRMRPIVNDEGANNSPEPSGIMTASPEISKQSVATDVAGTAEPGHDSSQVDTEQELGENDFDDGEPGLAEGEEDEETLQILTLDDVAWEMDLIEQEEELEEDEEAADILLKNVLES
ncbi:hypothetical protein EST38_g13444 [Candolleomyces aberdarensis]|uniref:DUF6589 domain-containing protein n=1 Tax=Candolleomyces aberdarensis TaxID=2316362 RepID=A0A4Q2CZX7_9AGAR|nr:hypothetical protein EST38_g13444 [Candolleomyces aberdarensis]